MTDWTLVVCGIPESEFNRLPGVDWCAVKARTRAYLPRYWRECVDVEFEREFACFWPERRVAA